MGNFFAKRCSTEASAAVLRRLLRKRKNCSQELRWSSTCNPMHLSVVSPISAILLVHLGRKMRSMLHWWRGFRSYNKTKRPERWIELPAHPRLYFAECWHPEEYDRAERGDDSICTQVPT